MTTKPRLVTRTSIVVAAAFALCAARVGGELPKRLPKLGEEYEISKSYETSQKGSDGSSGSSSGRDTIVERVIAIREDGIELEYDLARDTTSEDRARYWQFPARVLRRSAGLVELLNAAEMESRIDAWLKSAKWTREVCGRWIFTWNAFQIECDPQSVIKTIKTFDLSSLDAREGAPYRENGALGQGVLARRPDGSDNSSLMVVMQVDADAVRRERAESDVVVAEIMQKPLTLDAALRA